jgi:hypothetical protein
VEAIIATTVTTVRKRGFFGWVFLILFLVFNAFMALLLFGLWAHPGSGRITNGEVLGGGLVIFSWCLGSVILGLLALLTRGSKTVTTESG